MKHNKVDLLEFSLKNEDDDDGVPKRLQQLYNYMYGLGAPGAAQTVLNTQRTFFLLIAHWWQNKESRLKIMSDKSSFHHHPPVLQVRVQGGVVEVRATLVQLAVLHFVHVTTPIGHWEAERENNDENNDRTEK